MFNVQNPFSFVEYGISSPTHQKKGSQWLSELVAVDIFTLVWSSSQAAALASGGPFCLRHIQTCSDETVELIYFQSESWT